ncbi:MAG: class I SAM-dependent methyltransferase [Planctomycetota bacterium]
MAKVQDSTQHDIARGSFLDGAAPDVHSSSEGYAARFSGSVGAYLLGVQAMMVLSLIAPWAEAKVLEVGGGHAQLTKALVDAGHDVTVHGSVEACRERPDRLVGADRYTFLRGPLMKLPAEDNSYDVVVAMRLLAHVQDGPALVAELCRVARKAVIVDFASTRGANALAPVFYGLKKRLEGNTRHFLMQRPSEVRAMFSDRGWRCKARRGQFVLPLAAHRALKLPGVSRAIEGPPRAIGFTDWLGSPIVMRAEPDTPASVS